MKRGTVFFSTLTSVFFLTCSFDVVAQTGDDEESMGLLEEVVVTAQRREQSTMDVPISVMVFNAETIEQNNMKGAADYLLMTPNVNFREDGRGGHGSINIAIRGISDLAGGERVQATQAMGFYWDEFSVATIASGTANPPIYDIEAIEVLRGPQGTYFGRNAEGGAINIQTIKPNQEFYGQVDLGYGSHNTYEVSGVLNLPIGDTLALRTVLNNEKSDGFVDNTHPTGGSSNYELNSARTKLRWTPNERAIVDLGIAYSRNEQGYAPMVATCINPTFGFDPSDPAVLGGLRCSNDGGGSKTYQNSTRNSETTNTLLTANITYDWDNMRLTSITGQIKTDFDQFLDLDHSGIDSVDRINDYKTTSFSQELRLSSTGDNTVDWTFGGLVYKDELTANNIIWIKDFLGPWLRDDYANENQINIDRDGWALFADATWHINDRTHLTFGGRYSDDTDKQYWRNVFAACARRSPGDPLSPGCNLRPDQLLPLPIYTDGGGNPAISGGRAAQTEGTDVQNSGTDFSPRLAINFDLNDTAMLYGIWSQGYKSAGARANPDSGGENNSIFDKEKLNNYELGIKGITADGRLRYEVAAFYMRWTDFQATIRESLCRLPDGSLVPNTGIPAEDCVITPLDRIENADKATSKGLELTVSWAPVENWLFGLTAGYLDAKFNKFENVPIGGNVVDLSGEVLPNAPEFTSTLTGQYDFQAGQSDGYARLEWSYRDSYNIGLSDPGDLSRQVFPYVPDSYQVLNFRAGLDWGRSRLALTVDNILGENYTTGVDTFSYGGVMVDVHPTTVNLRYTVRTN